MVSHASSGITNRLASDQMGALRTMDPTVYNSWVDDFTTYASADWVVNETQAGATQAIVDGSGGLLALTNTTGASDVNQIQWAGGAGAGRLTMYFDTSKDYLMKSRFKVSDATNTAVLIGAATVDTTLTASLPTDGIYFLKASGATTLIASTRASGTSSSATLGAMANDTFVEASFVYTAENGIWQAWLNNSPVSQITTTTNSPTAGLCVSIALTNASGSAHVLTVDYLNIYRQR